MNNFLLRLNNITKSFKGLDAPILNNINLDIANGDNIAITGVSGTGKSTLLHIMAGLEKPNKGFLEVNGDKIDYLNQADLSNIRNKYYGFIYQFHHLLPDFSVIENVIMPMIIRAVREKDLYDNGLKLLSDLGLENRVNHLPHELSGGERQRVAIARAMITEPSCLLADEPTGNLDEQNAKEVLDLIIELNSNQNTALLIVTHDLSIANRMSRQLDLTDGCLKEK